MTDTGVADLDQRQRRTRAALHAALGRLMTRIPYRDIGVSLLAQEADVGRPTFYRHFTDVNALLIDRLGDDLADQRALARRLAADGADVGAAVQEITAHAFQRIMARPDLYRVLLDGSAGANASTLFRDQMTELTAILRYPTTDARRRHPALTIAMLSGAVSGFLLAWIEGGMTPPPHKAAALLIALVLPVEERQSVGPASPLGPRQD